MRLLLIAAVMAAIGMLTTSGIIALASADEFEADASTAVAMSDAELDAYISDLIDQQFAEILEERLEGSFGATHTASARN